MDQSLVFLSDRASAASGYGLSNADRDIRHSLGRLVGNQPRRCCWWSRSPQRCWTRTGRLCFQLGSVARALRTHSAWLRQIWRWRRDTESSLLPNANICGPPTPPSQKSLSAKIEAKVCQHLLDPFSRERHRMAHFVLKHVPESHIPLPLFRRRLRMPIRCQDSNCSLCGQVLDRWRDHCHPSRHNLIRDVDHSAANDRANFATVHEKPGLLIPRDPIDDCCLETMLEQMFALWADQARSEFRVVCMRRCQEKEETVKMNKSYSGWLLPGGTNEGTPASSMELDLPHVPGVQGEVGGATKSGAEKWAKQKTDPKSPSRCPMEEDAFLEDLWMEMRWESLWWRRKEKQPGQGPRGL